MGWKTRHAKASGNAVLAQHRIGGNPEPQTLRENLRLLDARFRHQNNEFVATIARDNIRLAALLFQQSPHAGQHQIPLEVTHGVIHLLELIQINQNNGERPARARCALPLRLHRLQEEPSRFRTGQAVGNRLPLQFLEHKRIVQGRGQQIRQGTQNQLVIRGKRALLLAFDVQYA